MSTTRSWHLERWLPVAALAVCGGALTWVSWRRWPDILIDFGRELYVPWRLAAGEVLYRDVAWIYGPLPPYLNAALMGLFGVGATTLFVANLVWTGLLCWLLYGLLRPWTPRWVATVAVAAFQGLFAFGHLQAIGNYNFIAPYAHAMTHGVILSIAALKVFQHFLRSGRPAHLGATALLCALVFMCKLEVFVALFAALVLGSALALRAPAHKGGIRAQLGWAASGFALPLLACFVLLMRVSSAEEAWRGMLFSWRSLFTTSVGSAHFHRLVMGIDRPAVALGQVAAVSAAYAAALGGAAGLDRLLARRPRMRHAAAGAAVLAVAMTAVWMWGSPLWLQLFRPLPVMMLGLAAWLAPRIRRGSGPARHLGLLTITVFALLLMLKIILRVHLDAYGFALAMPATLLAVAGALHALPRLVAGWAGQAAVTRAALLAAFTATALWYVQTSVQHYRAKSAAFGSAADRMLAAPDARTARLARALAVLDETRQPGESFVVVPEGVMLNYLLRSPSPVPYYNFDPTILPIYGDDAMLAALQSAEPDWIVWTGRESVEFGARFFGADYGQAIQQWIEDHYLLQHVIGVWPPAPGQFSVAIWTRSQSRSR